MMTLKEVEAWKRECGYTLRELTDDELQYFTDRHRVFNEGKYEGKICKFTGNVYGIMDLYSEMLLGYITVYKTSSGRKVFDQHRL